jgi:hypothetical protein
LAAVAQNAEYGIPQAEFIVVFEVPERAIMGNLVELARKREKAKGTNVSHVCKADILESQCFYTLYAITYLFFLGILQATEPSSQMWVAFIALTSWLDPDTYACVFPIKFYPPERLAESRKAETNDFTGFNFRDAEEFMLANMFPDFTSGNWDECYIADPRKSSMGPCK